MKKIGRNEPCPCGSGKKFKKCCLEKPRMKPVQPPPELIHKAILRFREKKLSRDRWIAQYGYVRPVIHSDNWGKKFVAIRNRIEWSDKWKYIPDFLLDYIPHVFGKDWFDAQVALPKEDRHPVFQWRAACFHQKAGAAPGAKVVVTPDGLSLSYLSFAFSLFAIEEARRLDEQLLSRLKHPEHFQGAFHEVFAESTCLRAGFQIERENENVRDLRHTEFTAIHNATGQHFSVEAKSKHYPGGLRRPGERQQKLKLHFGHLINEAVAKNPPHPLVIFLDTNLPFKSAHHVYGNDVTVPSRYIRRLSQRISEEHGGRNPYAMLVMTNMPSHYVGPKEGPSPNHVHAMMSENPGTVTGRALQALYDAVPLYGNIPNEFPEV